MLAAAPLAKEVDLIEALAHAQHQPRPPRSWTYEHRHRLTERVARLDADSLQRVLVLVFGDANRFRPRDEFTIDFEGLDRGVCATLDAFLDAECSPQAYTRARVKVGLPEAEPPAPLPPPPRPLPPRPRGLDPPVVVRIPRPPNFRNPEQRYSDPPAPLNGARRATAPSISAPVSRTGNYSREGGPIAEVPRYPARDGALGYDAGCASTSNASDDDLWDDPASRRRASSERARIRESFGPPEPRGRFPCPHCDRRFDHGPAAVAHSKTCGMPRGVQRPAAVVPAKRSIRATAPPPRWPKGYAPKWDPREDAELVALVGELGDEWATIAARLGTGRTLGAVEQRYYKLDGQLCARDLAAASQAARAPPPAPREEEDNPHVPGGAARGVEVREHGGAWRFFRSQSLAAEAYPGLAQRDISKLINAPRTAALPIRERFEARSYDLARAASPGRGAKTSPPPRRDGPPGRGAKAIEPKRGRPFEKGNTQASRGDKKAAPKRERSPSPARTHECPGDAYAPEPELARALEALGPKDTDAKREVLERYGFTCTKKGDRWTYKRGEGRAMRNLSQLQKELGAPGVDAPAAKKKRSEAERLLDDRPEEPAAEANNTPVREVMNAVDFGALPARCRVQCGSKYRACSVLAQERGLASSMGGWHRHLVLYDDTLSLQWLESTGGKTCKWWRGDCTKSERDKEAELAQRLGPKACDDVLAWLCSLDVSDALLHADPLVTHLLPKGCDRLRDVKNGSTLPQVKERLTERDYDDAHAFADDVRRVHETVVSACSKHLPRSWDEDSAVPKETRAATILHAAQVFRAAFESRWSVLLRRSSSELGTTAERRAQGAWSRKPKRGKEAPNFASGAGAVGKVVEVYWEGESEWFRGRLARYRDRDGKHRCDYDDGESEWLVLSENAVRFCEDAAAPKKKAIEPVNGFSCQRLGVLVWAKTGKYPWWPAETCLLSVEELTKHFPPNPSGQSRTAAAETTMVLYFGDVQMDAVGPDNVAPFSLKDPREREVPAPGLAPAITACIARAGELKIATDDVADP